MIRSLYRRKERVKMDSLTSLMLTPILLAKVRALLFFYLLIGASVISQAQSREAGQTTFAHTQVIVLVNTVAQLRTALKHANVTHTPTTIALADGIYRLSGAPLSISTDHITIRSQSGVRENVVLIGDGMGKGLGVLVDVSADYFALIGVTLKQARWHLIQVRAENDVDFFRLENSVLQDAGQQLLKVSHAQNGPYADFGIVTNSLFEYTAGIGPQYYIGGIDAHHAVDWLVENNTFKNIASPSERVAEHAVHFWNGSKDIRTLNNLIINCDRGIGYGLTNQENQNEGGVISHNIIIHTAQNHPFADVGIALESSPNTIVSNNIIFSTSTYPNAIEYRFTHTTGVLIEGNITNKAIKRRDGGRATLVDNITGSKSGQLLDNIQYLMNKQ